MVDDHLCIWHNCIRRDEGAQQGIVVAGVVEHQAAGVGLLTGEGEVGLEIPPTRRARNRTRRPRGWPP